MQNFAAIIRKAIEKDTRSLYAIAKDVGLRYSILHRFATGERTAINIVTAEKLCDTLGLELGRKRSR
jgi:ribosome-binding protein aMBF1 (putative translation factor)